VIELQNTIVKSIDEVLLSARVLGNMLGDAGSVVSVIDPQYTLLYYNEKAKEIFSWVKEGQKCYEAYRKGRKICKNCPTKEVLEKSKSLGGFKVHNKLVDRHLNVNSYLVLDEKGRQVAVIEVAHDITSMLIAAGKAHDANNLLTPITILDGVLTPETKTEKAYLELANQSAEKISNIMGDLQNILTGKARWDEYTRGPVDVLQALEDAIKFTKPQYDSCKIPLIKNIKPVPAIDGSQGALERAFRNMLINARQACEQASEPMITVNLYHKEGHIYAEFIDKGCGMEKGILAKIFDTYFTTKDKGHGLGLSDAKRVVEKLYYGKLTAESEGEGKGAKFTVKIPDAHTLKKLRKGKQDLIF
jgi:signal transduction histidine kinase